VVSDDFKAFYDYMYNFLAEERAEIKENLARGMILDDPSKYGYWVGQCLAYDVTLREMHTKFKRAQGDAFEDEGEL
jgi:hypothetical protein